MKRPKSTDANVKKLMGLEDDKAKFDIIRSKIFKYCAAKMPEDLEKYFDNGLQVKILISTGLADLQKEYSAEFRTMFDYLGDRFKVRDFLVFWVVECNRAIEYRRRHNPKIDLFGCSLQEARYQHRLDDDEQTASDSDSSDSSEDAGTSEEDTTTITSITSANADQSQAAPFSQEQDTPATQQHALPPAFSLSGSPSPVDVKVGVKRDVDAVEESNSEDGATPRKAIRLTVSPEPAAARQAATDPPRLAPPDWDNVILHFKGIDIEANDVRLPLRKLLYSAQSSAKDVHPYDLTLEDLSKCLRRTPMGQDLKLDITYARLAGEPDPPVLLDDGELSVMFMKWEALRSIQQKFEVMVVELWKSIETFSTVKG